MSNLDGSKQTSWNTSFGLIVAGLHEVLMAARHLGFCLPSGEVARPQSWRDLRERTKKAEEGKCVPCKTSTEADPEMSTLWGSVRRGCGLLLQGITATLHQARARTRKRRGRREPLKSVSLEGIQTKSIAQASQHNNGKIRPRTRCNQDVRWLRWPPFTIFLFACTFWKDPPSFLTSMR